MKTRNRISESDTLKIRAYGSNGKLRNVAYNSGYAIRGLNCTVKEVTVYNERNEKYEYYNANGRKL